MNNNMIKAKWALLVITALLSVVYVTSVSAVDSVSEMLDQDEKNRKPCNDYSLNEIYAVMNSISSIDHKNWKLQYKDKASIDLREFELELYACVDIDNDGLPEAILLRNLTGGAKCCHLMSVYKYDKGNLKHVDNFGDGDSGRSTRAAFKDLNNDGIKEIVTFRILDYLEDVPGAYSPELPLIYCYDKKRVALNECTSKFPQIIEREIQETLKQREQILRERAEMEKKYGPDHDYSDLKGNALQYLFLVEEMGKKKKKEAWRGLKKYYPQVYDEIKKEYGE